MTIEQFIDRLINVYNGEIQSIEKTSNSFPASYDIQLREDVDKQIFIKHLHNELDNLDELPDPTDLWVKGFGENSSKELVSIIDPYDAGYDGMKEESYEPFEINLDGDVLTVLPNTDGSFTIFNRELLQGTIRPNIEINTSLRWTTLDLMAEDYAQQIGELIEEHEM